VDNLTNDQNLVFTGFNQNSSGMTQGANYYFLEPRKFTFSVSAKY
jgi:hypothetical protein